MSEAFEPRILAFLCNWCAYAGADLAGISRFQYPPTVRVIRTMCSGRVDPMFVLEGLKSGCDLVSVFGCHFGDCHYLDGNVYAAKRMQQLEHLLEISGIGGKRVALRWVSAAEGQLFADTVRELTQNAVELGPFNPEAHGMQMAAVQRVITGQRARWLTGMDTHVTERENVYGEKVDERTYQKLLHDSLEAEYQKALILESLGEGALSVREMSGKTGLPVYTISLRLNDLERRGKAELRTFLGTTPKFVRLVA